MFLSSLTSCLFLLSLTAIQLRATIISTTLFQAPATHKKIIFLEDMHYLSKAIDPEQQHQLNNFFSHTTKQNSLIIEINPTQIDYYKHYAHNSIFAWIYANLFLHLYNPFSLYKNFTLLHEIYINSIEPTIYWPHVTTYPTDPRNFIDTTVCDLIQNALGFYNKDCFNLGYKRCYTTSHFMDYTLYDDFFEQFSRKIYVNKPSISIDTYKNRINELKTEVTDRISSLKAKGLIPHPLENSLKKTLSTSINIIEKIIQEYADEITEKSINHLFISIFNRRGSFNAAWIFIQHFWRPMMMLHDLSMLETIITHAQDPAIDNIFVFAGVIHTIAIQEYLLELGYSSTLQTNMVWLEAKNDNSFTIMSYLPPWLYNHLTQLTT